MKKLFNYMGCAVMVIALFSCNGNKPEATDLMNDSVANRDTKISDDMVKQLISAVPNPVQLSSLLQKSGVVYNANLLNPTSNIDKYNTNFKKALNLGIYGTDLVHMDIYERTVSTVLYLKNLKDLANDLKLGQYFDYETLNRLSENKKNIDSILYITNSGFDKMANFLISEKRSNISVLISYGTWIESLYLATNIETILNKKEVYQRVGEQKVVLDNIIILLQAYKSEPNFKEINDDADALKKEFDKVTIKYSYSEPTMKEVDGRLVIIDNSTSEITIDDVVFKSISSAVSKIRNKLIS